MTKKQSVEAAKSLMREIQYDNGMVNRLEGEQYDEKMVEMFAHTLHFFFEENPHFDVDETIDDWATGEEGENQKKYGGLRGYDYVSALLTTYGEDKPYFSVFDKLRDTFFNR